MEQRRLGKSGIFVSNLCCGTMTFGTQSTEEEAFAILDRAYDAGIDFYDTAEIYPVPPDVKYVHRTEEILGKWLKTKPRDGLIIASKVVGPAQGWFTPPIREGKSILDRHSINRAIKGSLRRLQTDYIDLYQTHWVDRGAGYEETLAALTDLKDEGLVRIVGSSNENAWGTMKAQATSASQGLVRYDTIQNNYSIVNRRFEDELAEICRREQISLLPFSPLGGGVCSGKYQDGAFPEGARFSNYMAAGPRQQAMVGRFVNEKSLSTVAELKVLADEINVPLAALCIAWSQQNDFTASTIFGATSLAQLEEILPAHDLKISAEMMTKIDSITKTHMYPLG
ncbi:MAG: aldo/keto reductase [Opitutaceae bacterium]